MSTELSIAEAGYLARGRRRAVLGVLMTLRGAGAVASARPVGVRQKGPPPDWADPLARAVHLSVSSPRRLWRIRVFGSARRALTATRKSLVSKGLLLPGWPVRTRAGRRALRELRDAYPLPEDRKPLDARHTGMIVAVHGMVDLPGMALFVRRAKRRRRGRAGRYLGDASNYNESWAIDGGVASHGSGTP